MVTETHNEPPQKKCCADETESITKIESFHEESEAPSSPKEKKINSRGLWILIAIAVLLVGAVVFLKYTPGTTQFLWDISRGGAWLLPLVVISALIDSINPCAFSILLLTVAFLMSLGKVRSKILVTGLVYIAGLFVVYVLIGLGILKVLHIFNTPHFMARVGALLLIVLGGINVINEFFPRFPIKLRIPQAAHHKMATLIDRASLPTAFILGILVGLCEFPCTGGPYLMILGLLHDRGTYLSGLGYLGLYNLIFVLPLLVLLFIASNKKLFEKAQAWQIKERTMMRLGGGIVMIALGIIIFFL